MTDHRYPIGALVPDYSRAGIGLAVTGGPLLLTNPAPAVLYALSAMALLFAVFGARTAIRQLTRIEMSERGVWQRGPLGTAVPWEGLTAVTVRYFSTRRDRKNGWMQLRLKGRRGSILVDSTIEQFDLLASRVVREAVTRGIGLDETTRVNLVALGLDDAVRVFATEPG
ncbi:MAG: hypothetical protein FJX56_05235 [Alphaproteobacteria bacterium]|nr:hypothetical protein [Alphaproteobacteria bacterium]